MFNAQKDDPISGDWINLIKSDFELINEPFDENKIKMMTVKTYKKFVKQKVSEAAFLFLTKNPEKQSKTNFENYTKLSCQDYIKNGNFTNSEVMLLFKLRSRMYKVKSNFKNGNPNLDCQLGCGEIDENQQHILLCEKILEKMTYKIDTKNYVDIFGSKKKQKALIKIFSDMITIRENLLENV